MGYIFYNQANPNANVIPTTYSPTGKLNFGFRHLGSQVSWARLDYILITYWHRNSMLSARDGQLRMHFTSISGNDRIDIADGSRNLVVWNVDMAIRL